MSITYYLAGVCIRSLYEAQSKPRNRPRLAIHQNLTLYGIAGLVRRYKCPIFPAEKARGHERCRYLTLLTPRKTKRFVANCKKSVCQQYTRKSEVPLVDQMKLGDWMRSFNRWIFLFFFSLLASVGTGDRHSIPTKEVLPRGCGR